MEEESGSGGIPLAKVIIAVIVIGLLALSGYGFFTFFNGLLGPAPAAFEAGASPTPVSEALANVSRLAEGTPVLLTNQSDNESGTPGVALEQRLEFKGGVRKDMITVANTGGAEASFSLLVAVPKELAASASALDLPSNHEILLDDPVVRIPVALKGGESKEVTVGMRSSLNLGIIVVPVNDSILAQQPELVKGLAQTLQKFASTSFIVLSPKDAADLSKALGDVLNDPEKTLEDKVRFLEDGLATREFVTPPPLELGFSELLPGAIVTIPYFGPSAGENPLVKITGSLSELTSFETDAGGIGGAQELNAISVRFRFREGLPEVSQLTGRIALDEMAGELVFRPGITGDEIGIPINVTVNHDDLIGIFPNRLTIFSNDSIAPQKLAFAVNNLPYNATVDVGFTSLLKARSTTELALLTSDGFQKALVGQRKKLYSEEAGANYGGFSVTRVDAANVDESLRDAVRELAINDVLAPQLIDTLGEPRIVSDEFDCANAYCSCSQAKTAAKLAIARAKEYIGRVADNGGLYQWLFYPKAGANDSILYAYAMPVMYYGSEEKCKIDEAGAEMANGGIYALLVSSDLNEPLISNETADVGVRTGLIDLKKRWLVFGFNGTDYGEQSDEEQFRHLVGLQTSVLKELGLVS